jgi:aminoacrylate hydrolase
MDALEIERADLIGHSTGGAMGQVMALDHADRLDKLVLSATWAGRDPYFELLFSDRKRVLNEMGAAEYMRSLMMVAFPPEWIRDNHEAIANPDPKDVASRVPTLHCGTSRIDAIRKFDRRAQMSAIKAPTLVICARDDMVTPAYLSEELAAGIPGAKAFYLSDGGHFYTTSRPKTFQREVVAFLDGGGGAAVAGSAG